MEKDLERLTTILKSHTERHEQLLQLAEEKRLAIINHNPERVDEITEAENALIQAVQANERERLLCVEAMGRELELKETPTLDLLASMDKEMAEILEPLRNRLTAVLEQLRYRTQQNAKLLCHSIGHIVSFFQTIADARTKPATYSRIGKSHSEQLHMVDHTA